MARVEAWLWVQISAMPLLSSCSRALRCWAVMFKESRFSRRAAKEEASIWRKSPSSIGSRASKTWGPPMAAATPYMMGTSTSLAPISTVMISACFSSWRRLGRTKFMLALWQEPVRTSSSRSLLIRAGIP